MKSKDDRRPTTNLFGIWLLLWWGLVAGMACVYDFHPPWAFITIISVSVVINLLMGVWRQSWFQKLRLKLCGGDATTSSSVSSTSSSFWSCCCCGCCGCKTGFWAWLCCTKVHDDAIDEKRNQAAQQQEQQQQQQQQMSSWRTQIRICWQMSLPYFQESSRGRCLFVGMIMLTLLASAVNVVFSYTSKEFYNALERKDAAAFGKILILYTSILVVGAPVTALYVFQRERLAIAWRDWMTHRTLDLYTSNRVYYHLDSNTIDNPDQRISQDVNAFTSFSLRLLVTILDNTINLISFSVILFTIDPSLFLIILAYTFVGTVITSCIGGRLVPLNFKLLRYEADFRYCLVRFREYAESIAFYKGERLEKETLESRFESVLDTRRDIIGTERNLQMFTSLYQYLTWVVPIAVVAPDYFAGAIELGVVMQARSAFLQIVDDLSL
jgi:ABC-type uncharacterized transport system fused permease/ATPase subunit